MTDHAEETEGTGEDGGRAAGVPAALLGRTGFLLSSLGRRFRAATEHALAPLGITPVHYGVLSVLAARGPAAQAAVGQTLRIDKSSMVVIMDQLEQRGLVERQRNPRNRRAYELILTAAGTQALRDADRIIAASEEAGLAALDQAERDQLHRLLLRLLRGPDGREQAEGIDAPATSRSRRNPAG
ncbi:MAG TPA: MarR family transcriptional regulator [Herpetosiphonaceae bacterium]|nr:MarR family transcriptional regulator [Herpetosiphonaceae bacterium]